jgi:prepilin-type processing-associated H-X9-DG protein
MPRKPRKPKEPISPALRELLQACLDLETTDSHLLAERLHRSPHTIDTEFQRIFAITGCRDRGGVLIYALRQGWVTLTPHRHVEAIASSSADTANPDQETDGFCDKNVSILSLVYHFKSAHTLSIKGGIRLFGGYGRVQTMKDRWAFTMVELLVTIAIISLLAGMLFPVLGRAREKARQEVCTSNMHEEELGLQMYTQDYDEAFPTARIYTDPQKYFYHTTWRAVVMPYTKNDQILICPSAPWLRNEFDWPGDFGCLQDGTMTRQDWLHKHFHSESNLALNGDVFNNEINHKIRLDHIPRQSWIRRPSELILILETRDFWPDLGTWTFPWEYDAGGGSLPSWHNKGGNWAFADGHVKWMRLASTVSPTYMWYNSVREDINDRQSDYCGAPNVSDSQFVDCLLSVIPPAYR